MVSVAMMIDENGDENGDAKGTKGGGVLYAESVASRFSLQTASRDSSSPGNLNFDRYAQLGKV
jgi:hypothetical protein